MLALERAMGRKLFVRHDLGYEMTTEARKLLEDLTEIRVLRRSVETTALHGHSLFSLRSILKRCLRHRRGFRSCGNPSPHSRVNLCL